MKEVKCQVCRNPVMVDQLYHADGPCNTCGWMYERGATDRIYSWTMFNVMSLDKARHLYKVGKPIKPDFEDFMDFYDGYGEVQFTYQNVVYGMWGADGDGSIDIWASDVSDEDFVSIKFSSIEDFKANARIDGVLIKDLWDEVTECGTLE